MVAAVGSQPWVAILVVNWNGVEDTMACLDSLEALHYPARRVYVVDNASTDGSTGQVRAAHPRAEVLEAPQNLGYAGAFNLGSAQALADGAEYLWLLNNDTTVSPEALEVLLAAQAHLGPAIYSPKILRFDRAAELWYAGGYLDWRFKSHHIGRGEVDHGQYDCARRVEWASGCSLFCSAGVVRRIGPMDERYFLYLEDVDWCLRARTKGIPTYFIPEARVFHRVSRSVDRMDPRLVHYYSWRNYYLLASRHGRWWQRLYAFADLASRFAKIGIRQALFPAYRADAYYHARTRGLVDFVRGRLGEGHLPPRGDGPVAMAQQVPL